MAQTAIQGKDVYLEAYKDNSLLGIDSYYQPFVCADTIEFTYDTELIEKATVGMAGFKGFRPGMGEWSIRLSSVTHIVPPTGTAYTAFDTLLESLRKNGLDIRLTFEDNLGNLQVITGHALIPHTGIHTPSDGFSEDDIELKGDGAFALDTTQITPTSNPSEVKKFEYTATGGETLLTYSDAINRTILFAQRGGVVIESITSGSPTAQQVKYTSSSGSFLFGAALGPNEYVLILYK